MTAGTPLQASVSRTGQKARAGDFENEARTDQDLDLVPDCPPERVEAPPKARRGFAAIDRKRLSEIASQGGKAAHAAGTAHKFTGEEARVAGRKGGRTTHANRRERLNQGQDVPGATPASRENKSP
jgi:general stress protein YciG